MAKPGFRSPAAETAFNQSYDRALAAWPEATQADDILTDLGRTRVYQLGPVDAPPLVLLHGAGATAMTWVANVGPLSRSHRLIVPDVPGQAGRSVVQRAMATGAEAVLAWLDQLLDRIGVDGCAIAGHSYGAWLALYAALGSRPPCRSLILLDPTTCFVDPGLGYRVRAIPAFVRPGALGPFVAWETGGRPLEPLSHDVHLASAAFRGVGTEVPRLPNKAALEAFTTPMLVVGAARSRQHDTSAMLAEAAATGSNVETVLLPDATHFTLPATDAEPVNEAIDAFLARTTA